MDKIELLAPAGSKDAFLAAIAAGADAIYFGTNQFNARERAENIKLEDLPELVSIAKNHNVRTYLTLNVLIYDHELKAALELVKNVTEIGVDAVIVQDLGIFSLIRQNFPNVEIHASTQLTTHNLEQCKFLVEMGAKQINLSRELSLEEIKPMASYLKSQNVGCEIFVHGAYCISFSGQCYLSGELYGLKGNRGTCVQPCRRQYTLSKDSFKTKEKPFTPFNLKDNCAFPLLKELIEAGATSLKIEGRIKSPEYVFAVTQAYREQIDRIYKNQKTIEKDTRLDFSMNRSFSTGYLEGRIHKSMFTYGHKDHSLVYAGKVFSFFADKGILSLNLETSENLNPGFLITILKQDKSFVTTGVIQEKISNNEYKIKLTGKLAEKIKGGYEVYFTKELITKEALSALTSKLKPASKNIFAFVDGKADTPLKATFTLEGSSPKETPFSISLSSQSLLQPASNKALTKEVIQEKFSRLGGTDFQLASLELSLDFAKESLFLPLGELNNLRRMAVEHFQTQFAKEKTHNPQQEIKPFPTNRFLPISEKDFSTNKKNPPIFFFSSEKAFSEFATKYQFNSNNFPYITSLLEIPLTLSKNQDFYLRFFQENPKVVPYFSSILFQNHFEEVIDFLETAQIKTIVADNLGLISIAKSKNIDIILGYHLNIFNSGTIAYFQNFSHIKGQILSPELSKEELCKLTLPQNTEIWLPDFSNFQLMQSRQCLLRNIPDKKTGLLCQKECTNHECIENCSKESTIFGTQKESLIVKKRQGFYSALYPKKNEKPCNYSSLIENLSSHPQNSSVRQIFYITDI